MAQEGVRRWEMAGLHFAFERSGYWQPVAWLAADDESVWEHLKLASWPARLYALAEYVGLFRDGLTGGYGVLEGYGIR